MENMETLIRYHYRIGHIIFAVKMDANTIQKLILNTILQYLYIKSGLNESVDLISKTCYRLHL